MKHRAEKQKHSLYAVFIGLAADAPGNYLSVVKGKEFTKGKVGFRVAFHKGKLPF